MARRDEASHGAPAGAPAGRLAGKVAVVTGAGTGVGRETMRLFAREGARVVGASRTLANLNETLALVKEDGCEGVVVAADVSTEAGADEVIDTALDRFGRLDVLVNNAGVGWSYESKSPGSMADLAGTPPDAWREVLDINVGSFYLMTRRALREMRPQRRGSIVTVASIAAFAGLANGHTYTAGKGAVVSLTHALAATYGPEGIRTNCVAPGLIDTPMITDDVKSALLAEEARFSTSPLGRAATPLEVAYGCLFFASDEASYCNGSVLVMDGGTLSRLF